MHEKYVRDMIDLLQSIQNIDYIEPDEIPNIDLYRIRSQLLWMIT